MFWTCLFVCVQGSQRELLNLSQQDYANRIEELNQSLKEAWASDQKVKALKIVIQVIQRFWKHAVTKSVRMNLFSTDLWSVFQCSKLLSDTSVIQFYPSKFVLITDILDTFGGYGSLISLSSVKNVRVFWLSCHLFVGRLVYDRIWTMCSDPRPLPGTDGMLCFLPSHISLLSIFWGDTAHY